MKPINYFNVCVMSFLILLFIFSGCKKDDDNSKSTSFYRITDVIYYSDGQKTYKGTYEYENSRIKQNIQYAYEEKGDWVERYRQNIDYPDNNSAIMLEYLKDNGTWEKYSKSVITYDKGKTTEWIDYNYTGSGWEANWKDTWTYTNGKMTQYMFYSYNAGSWDPSWKEIGEYDGQKLLNVFNYDYEDGNWVEIYKEVFTYNGNEIEQMVTYSYNSGSWETSWKYVFAYSSGKIAETRYYDYQAGDWEYEGKDTYQYDENGNIITNEFFNVSSGSSYLSEMNYESGVGNFRNLYDADELAWYYWYPMPTKGFGRNSSVNRQQKVYQ